MSAPDFAPPAVEIVEFPERITGCSDPVGSVVGFFLFCFKKEFCEFIFVALRTVIWCGSGWENLQGLHH